MERRHFIKTLGASVSLLEARRAWPQSSRARLVLAENGRSSYSIYLSPEASPSEKHGAQELQRFFQEMSGARLPLLSGPSRPAGSLILVGQSAVAEQIGIDVPLQSLGAEGYTLKTHGEHLLIAGGRQRGTMYGVYGLLEKFGCRWFTPQLSRIPKLTTLTVPALDETGRPTFEYRYPFFAECADRDWSARNRMNGEPALDASTGGSVQYYPFVHSFYLLIPPAKYFKDHPEYFALVDGKRRAERAQLCLTNPDVLRISTSTVLQWIQDHPEATLFSVSQNDSAGWCECDNCRRVEEEEGGAHSGPILRFVNAIAGVVAKKYPDKLIDTIAYQYSQSPPSKTRPLPNVRIRLCPIGACQGHPYATCRYDAYIMKDLRGWSKITGPQLYVWHYVTNFSHTLRPFPDFDEISADIPMYRSHGVVGLFMEGFIGKGGGAENADLRSYVMARLLWDDRADAGRAINEFHTAYYGNAAAPMKTYFNSLQRVVRFPPAGEGQHVWCCASPHFSGAFLRRAHELFRQAEAAAESHDVRRRVRKAQLSIDYLDLVRAKQFSVQNGWYRPQDLRGLKSQYQSLMKNVRSFGITTLSEGGSLERDEQKFAELIKPYRVVRLENASLVVLVVPELSGRIIQIMEKASGTNALLDPDPNSTDYPDISGLAAFAYPAPHATHSWKVSWALKSEQHGSSLVLAGTCENGLRLTRKIALEENEPRLRTETTVENAGDAVLGVSLQLQLEMNPGGETPADMDNVWVRSVQQDGKTADLKLIHTDGEPDGRQTYSGASGPPSEWHVVNRRTGLVIMTRFQSAQVERCELSWSTKNWSAKNQNRVTLLAWTREQTLQKGQTFTFAADYSVALQRVSHARKG